MAFRYLSDAERAASLLSLFLRRSRSRQWYFKEISRSFSYLSLRQFWHGQANLVLLQNSVKTQRSLPLHRWQAMPKVGKTFNVRIHVKPGGDWHVYSSKMASEGGLTPLTLQLPTDLDEFFEITKLEETGDLHTGFDSNFMAVTMAHYTPYDIIATVKVKRKRQPRYRSTYFCTTRPATSLCACLRGHSQCR